MNLGSSSTGSGGGGGGGQCPAGMFTFILQGAVRAAGASS
jgi:hypothetical protein